MALTNHNLMDEWMLFDGEKSHSLSIDQQEQVKAAAKQLAEAELEEKNAKTDMENYIEYDVSQMTAGPEQTRQTITDIIKNVASGYIEIDDDLAGIEEKLNGSEIDQKNAVSELTFDYKYSNLYDSEGNPLIDKAKEAVQAERQRNNMEFGTELADTVDRIKEEYKDQLTPFDLAVIDTMLYDLKDVSGSLDATWSKPMHMMVTIQDPFHIYNDAVVHYSLIKKMLEDSQNSGSNEGTQPSNTPPSYKAEGTNFWKGGYTVINERGDEMIELPRGSKIYPAHETGRRMMEIQEGGSKSVIISGNTFHIREDADIRRIATEMVQQLERASLAMA